MDTKQQIMQHVLSHTSTHLPTLLGKLETVGYLVPSERPGRREAVCSEALEAAFIAGAHYGVRLGAAAMKEGVFVDMPVPTTPTPEGTNPRG